MDFCLKCCNIHTKSQELYKFSLKISIKRHCVNSMRINNTCNFIVRSSHSQLKFISYIALCLCCVCYCYPFVLISKLFKTVFNYSNFIFYYFLHVDEPFPAFAFVQLFSSFVIFTLNLFFHSTNTESFFVFRYSFDFLNSSLNEYISGRNLIFGIVIVYRHP